MPANAYRLGAGTLVSTHAAADFASSGTPGKRSLVEAEAARLGNAPSHAATTGHAGAVISPTTPAPTSAPLADGQNRSAIERARALCRLGIEHLGAIETALVPAYRRAVGALDSAAVKALASQIIGGVARIVDAQAHVVRLVPQVDHSSRAARASTPETAPGVPDPVQLAALDGANAALDTAISTRVPKIAVQVSPQWLGEELVAGGRVPEPEPHVRQVLVQLAYEAGLVVQLLEDADAIEALIRPTDAARGTSEPVTEGARAEAVDHLERWRSRPINFLFLRGVLIRRGRGLWPSLQGAQSLHGRTAAELERKVTTQAKETGATADVGEQWDADEARQALSYSRTDWRVTDDEASRVLEMLGAAEPRARGELVKQLHRMGRLRPLCEHLPWGAVKELWESIPDPVASKLLEPYWDGKGGGASLGKRLRAQDHWYTNALDTVLNIATFGAKPRIDNAYDAREAGLISDDAYWSTVHKAIGRAAVVMAASTVAGGMASELVAGASEGLGLASGRVFSQVAGRAVTRGLSGTAAGGVGNVAGHLATDVYDQVLDGKAGFDPLSMYGRSFGEGAALGGLTESVAGAAGLVPARYLPRGLRTIAQELAATHPRLTTLLEAVRSASRGVACRVRMTVGEYLEAFATGVPPEFRLAFAGGPVPPHVASAPRDSTLWVTVRPLQDLNAPLQMQGRRDGFIEIASVESDTGSMFDSYGEGSSYADEASDWRAGDDVADIEHSESSKDIGIAEPRKGGKLDNRRVRHVDQKEIPPLVTSEHGTGILGKHRLEIVRPDRHHLLPQSQITYFQKRGFPGRDIDKFCIEIERPEHEMLHGGNQSLARRHWQEREWSTALMRKLHQRELHRGRMLKRNEILDIVEEQRIEFTIENQLLVRYTARP